MRKELADDLRSCKEVCGGDAENSSWQRLRIAARQYGGTVAGGLVESIDSGGLLQALHGAK